MIALAPTAAACVACRTRDCCRDRDAPLTGADVVRIATALEVAPTSFATVAPASDSPDAPDVFLTSERRPVRLVLARRAEPDGHEACVFLLALGSGRRLCGLGALAPTACRLHPAIGPEPGACWRTFTADEVAPARAALADRLRSERAAWHAFLADVAAKLRGRPCPIELETLLDAQLAAAAAPIEAAGR